MEDCGILHRDVSAANIMIVEQADGTRNGLLNDWDMAQNEAERKAEPRQKWRTVRLFYFLLLSCDVLLNSHVF